MTDKEKIEKIMLDKHLNNSQFSTKVGITPGTLSHIISGRTNPTLNILRSIKFVFPDINPSWLFFDDGPMYISDSDSDVSGDAASVTGDESASELEGQALLQPDLFSLHNGMTSPAKQPVVSPRENVAAVSPALSYIDVADVVEQTIKRMQRPQRKIVEVRIFFDDGTFEAFSSK